MMHRPHCHSGPLIATIVLAVLVKSLNAQSGSGLMMCMDGDIRLANQTSGYSSDNRMYIQGFVEICYNDSYGAICEDGWDNLDARVVCSELYDTSYDAQAITLMGRPSSDIILQDVQCSGTEIALADCPNSGFGNLSMSCANSEFAAAVECTEPVPVTPLCSEGDVMIANATQDEIDGFFSYGGRVEVCYNGTYAPICDQGWGEPEATVICGIWGYYSPSYRPVATGNQTFGLSDETPVLQDLMCSGAEYSLMECPGYDLGNVTGDYCLNGDYQAGIRCIQVPTPTVPCSDGNVQLANMTMTYIGDNFAYGGRVEVCYNGTYRPVCDLGWDTDDAAVVCNLNSYSAPFYLPEATGGTTFGLSDEIPVLQNLMCNGTEYSLSDCPGYALNNVSGDYCLSGENQAGVYCVEQPTPTMPCVDGNIRLGNETSTFEDVNTYGGRVEVCYNGTYRPVCDSGWDVDDAAVVLPEATTGATFGLSDETPVLQDLMCRGIEYSLSVCPGYALNNVSGNYCLSGQGQAGVRCVERCMEESVRLGNETNGNTIEGYFYVGGRVEYCENGRYGAICDIGWNQRAAQATCNQVGYPDYVARPTFGSTFGRFNGPILFQNITCDAMLNCTGLNATDPDCNGNRTAGVLCVDEPRPCTDGELRLSNATYDVYNGFDFYGGRVEVCLNGTYGPICDQDWDDQDASVVCSSLEYSPPDRRGQATTNATFGLSSQPPVLQGIMCNGTEETLSECAGYNLGEVSGDYCLSGLNQAGIRCLEVVTPCSFEGSIQLSAIVYETRPNITDSFRARVDYCYSGTLGGICDIGWDNADAEVACRHQYGEGYLSEALTGLDYGPRTPVIDNVMCNGSESLFDDCPTSQPGQVDSQCESSSRAAGVRCYQVCYDGEVRLAGGEHTAIGRVEVCENNVWGTVCDLGWDDQDAEIACRSAGFYWGGEAVENIGFGMSTAPILAYNVSCNGSEYELGDCENSTDIPALCTHELDAAASCQPGYINMNIAYNQSIGVVAGRAVTIWCNAESPSVANFTSSFWENSQGEIMDDGQRINITIHNASYSDYYGQFIFNSSLTYSPILLTDGDLHTCGLTIALPNVGTNISNTTSRSIRVEIPSPQLSIETEGTPIAGTMLTATCIAEFYPGVPLQAVQMEWISVNLNSELMNNSQIMYGNTEQINATHFQRTITVNSLQVTDTGNYTCRVGVDGEYVYTRVDTNLTVELIVTAPSMFVAPPMDVNLVVTSSSVRSNTTSTSVASFTCIVSAVPPATIVWEYTRDAGDGSIQDPRITIRDNEMDPSGAVISNLTFTAVEVSDRGTFACTASNPVGTVSASADLRIFVVPNVTLESVSATSLTEGDEIDLNCRVSGSWPQPTQIQWLRNDIPFLGSDARVTINTSSPTTDSFGLYDQSSRLTIPSSLPGEDSGQYTCTVYVGIPDIPTLSRDLSITVQIRNECIVQIDPLVTPCVNGWCVDGLNTYRCICNDGFTGRNCDEEVTTEVAPEITEPPMRTTGRVGQAINLTCIATGVPTPTITWFRDGSTVEGAVFQFLYLPSAKPEDRGYYYCTAGNTQGSVQSDSILLTLDGIQQYSAALTFPSRRKREATPAETLASMLTGRMLGDTGVTIYSATLNSVDEQTGDANLLITLAVEEDFPPGGVTGGLSDEITSTAQATGLEVTIEITRFDGCPMELGPAYLPFFPDLRIEWPESEIGQNVNESCVCGSLDTTGIDRQATRVCGGNYTDGAVWMAQEVSQCDFSNTTLQLCQATQQPIDNQASDVADIVSDPAVVDAETFSVAAEIVSDLFSGAVTNANIRDNVFASVEGLLNVNVDVAQESHADSQSGELLLDAIDDFTADVMIPAGQNTLTYSQESVAVISEQANVMGFEGRTFSTNTRNNFNTNRVQTTVGTTIPDGAVASLTLPGSLFDDLSIANGERRLGFSVFSEDTFFQPRSNSDAANAFAGLEIGGPIISAFIRGVTVSGLTNRVSLTFQKSTPNVPATCVFWNPTLDSGFGGFSTEGCNTDDSENQAVCRCDHLTSFTIFVNTSATPTPPTTQPTTSQPTSEPVEDDSDHSAVVFLLLSICLVILIAIIALHLGIKVLRVTDESKIVINYAFALFGLYFITMLAYGEDMPEGACRLWAYFLVYFFLVALSWGFVEALYIMLRRVIPSFGAGFFTKNFVWIAMPLVWVIPIVPAFISLGGLDYFGEKRLCQVYNWPFYVFMIAPFVIFYVFDWICYMASLAIMTHSIPPSTSAGKLDVHRSALFHIFIAMTLSIFFGIGWAFGFLASSNDVSRGAYLTGQYLFSFLILTHTILLLVLYLIRTSVSRDELKRIWYIITCRTQKYVVSARGSQRRTEQYITNAERGTELGRVEESGHHDEKVPLAKKEVEGALPIETTPAHGHTVMENPVGAKNPLADEEEAAATSITNQSAVEASDEEEKPISHL